MQGNDVHGGCADKARGKRGCGPGIDFARPGGLFHQALVEQHHLIGHAHGLGLIVGHIDHREAQTLLQLAQLGAHFLAQLGIEIGQRLVHQADPGLRHQRTAQRHALLLAARELPGPALQQRRQPQQLGRLLKTLPALGLADLAHLQTELDVVGHAQMREQRIVLEHHGNAALRRRQMGNVATIDAHRPRGGHVQPGNHAQGGGFAAARRAEQDAERAWFNAQIHGMQGRGVTPGFGDVLQLDQRHRASLERLDDSRVST